MWKALDEFKKITKVPRPSWKEWKIRTYLSDWAVSRWYEHKSDSYGNIVIYVPSLRYPDSSAVILQAHMDMVCVKSNDSAIDFENDALDIFEEDWFLKAKWTSLWADNWVWIALAMTAADLDERPNLELLFTVAEEIGLLGALNCDFTLLRICVSRTIEQISATLPQYNIKIKGLKWWHSWVEIHKNHANSAMMIVEFLCMYPYNLELISISSWTADNVIPSSAEVIVWCANPELIKENLDKFLSSQKEIYDCPNVEYEISLASNISPYAIDLKDLLLEKIRWMKIWVLSYSTKISWLVQTSMNLWILSLDANKLEITYLPRSSDMSEFSKLLNDLERYYSSDSYIFENHWSYPGWQDDPNWVLVSVAKESFMEVNGKYPEIIAVHAWLECWALVAWLGVWASAISIGPDMYDIHSIKERLNLESLDKFERIITSLLAKLVH